MIMTVLLELLTALSQSFYGIMLSTGFLAVKALLSPQNASIIPGSYTHLLCSNYAGIITACLSSYNV